MGWQCIVLGLPLQRGAPVARHSPRIPEVFSMAPLAGSGKSAPTPFRP